MKSKLSKRLIRNLVSFFLTILPLTLALSSCQDEISTLGSSLVTDRSEVVVDSTFTVYGESVPTKEFRARTLSQLLGQIQARRYGSLTSDYVTQLMPSADFDTTGVTAATVDSVSLLLRFYSDRITGDSMIPMGVNIFALTRQLPSVLTSAFDPEGYYDPSAPISSGVYSSNTLYSDSLEKMGVHIIETKLPIEFGQMFVTQYRNNPELFSSPEAFAQMFPGIYVANSFGAGRVTNIFNTRVMLFYHSKSTYTNSSGVERDTIIYHTDIIAASTPEVQTNNNLRFTIDPEINALASSKPILVGPIGYECLMHLPISEVISSFRNGSQQAMGVVNSLTLSIPAEEITNDYGIKPPAHILLVPSRDRDKFFDEQMIPDNETSFIADYNSTTGNYVFSGLRPLLIYVMNGGFDASETEALSTFSIVPVEVAYEDYTNSSYQTVSVITAVGPSVESPSMGLLKFEDAKLKLTYSTETTNF